MGSREDRFINDEPGEDVFRRMLEQHGALEPLEPPPDIVTRMMRQLPQQPPAAVAYAARQRDARRRLVLGVVGSLVGLALMLGLWNMLAGGQPLVAFAGTGSSAIGRLVLMISLLLKPIYTVLAARAPLFSLSIIAVVALGGWMWWWLIQRTPVMVPVEAQE